ncbi:MAG: CTP synthase, partial [uncultured Blastococcus sp.]
AGRVRRAAPGDPPVLRRHAGAPRAEEPPDPAAPAVRRVRAGRRRVPGERPPAGARRRGGEGRHL